MGCPNNIPCKQRNQVAQQARIIVEKPLTTKQVAKQFGASMTKWAKSGFKTASKPAHAQRYATCVTCPHMVAHFCEKCKCLVLAKTKLATESCPLGKW